MYIHIVNYTEYIYVYIYMCIYVKQRYLQRVDSVLRLRTPEAVPGLLVPAAQHLDAGGTAAEVYVRAVVGHGARMRIVHVLLDVTLAAALQ